MYTYEILGKPVSWKAHGGYGKRSYNPRHIEKIAFQTLLRPQIKSTKPITCAVQLRFDFVFEPPKSVSNKTRALMLSGDIPHTVRPDCTNLQKFAEDCLKGLILKDDSQVVGIYSNKYYGEAAKTFIVISPFSSGDIPGAFSFPQKIK